MREIFLGQIDAAHLIIFRHVAQDVGQLKRDAQLFRQVRRVRIVKSKHMQARQAHGSGHAVAVFAQPVERRVIADGQIHFRAGNQIVKIARGNVETLDRVRKRGKDRMARNIAGYGRIQRGAPARQAALLVRRAAHRVRNVVDQAHERVERAQRVALGLRQHENA